MTPLNKLRQLVPPPKKPYENGPEDVRAKVEKQLKTGLPDDLFKFCATYGSGEFRLPQHSNVVRVHNPFSGGYISQLKQDHEMYRDLRRDEGKDFFPYKVYPAKSGLLLWGSGENQRAFFWLTDGEPNSWPVVLMTPEDKFVRLETTMTQFLVDLFEGQLDGFGGTWDAAWFRNQNGKWTFKPDTPPSPDLQIFLAASQGDGEKLKELLGAGADPNANAPQSSGDQPLHAAIEAGSIECMRVLLEAGANPNAPGRLWPPLARVATDKIKIEAMQLLLTFGADVNAKDRNGDTALMSAAYQDNKKKAQLLIQNGADVNAKSKRGTPLSLAANDAMRKILIKAGATE